MQKVQKTYTQQFKRETLQITRTCEKPITQGARELGIHNCSIHQWRKTLAEHGYCSIPNSIKH